MSKPVYCLNTGEITAGANKVFVDLDDNEIKNIFKLYPWEWLLHDEFGKHLMQDRILLWFAAEWKSKFRI